MSPTCEAFRAAIRDAGLHPPTVIVADGKLHRFSSDGRRNNLAGWYVLHEDGNPAGKFGDWRTGLSRTWRGGGARRRLTPTERAAWARRLADLRAARDREEAKRHALARTRAADILARSLPAPHDHGYLMHRKIGAHGLRQIGGLVVPVTNGAEIASVQFIGPAGDKRFLLDGMVKGCHFVIGEPDGVLCVAEGFATTASIREATGYAAAVAFNAGNLVPAAMALRQRFPALQLIICADDDWKTPGNPGLTKARAAAQAVNGCLCVPVFGADRPDHATDFNDLQRLHGSEAVRDCLGRATPSAPVP